MILSKTPPPDAKWEMTECISWYVNDCIYPIEKRENEALETHISLSRCQETPVPKEENKWTYRQGWVSWLGSDPQGSEASDLRNRVRLVSDSIAGNVVDGWRVGSELVVKTGRAGPCHPNKKPNWSIYWILLTWQTITNIFRTHHGLSRWPCSGWLKPLASF